jgi:hypothetical protein
MLTAKNYRDILTLLGRVNLTAAEALPYVQLCEAVKNEADEADKRDAAAAGAMAGLFNAAPKPTGNIPPEIAAVAVATSDTTKPTRKLRRAIATVVSEAQKQQEAAQ